MCASGPNKDQDVRWVYTRAGMPVEVTAEFENWRRIRDWEGAEGWVYHSLLSGKRTALVVPTAQGRTGAALRQAGYEAAVIGAAASRRARRRSSPATAAGAGSPARASTAGSSRSGLWGVYPNEKVE